MAAFVSKKYEMDDAVVCKVRMASTTFSALSTNTEPDGDVDLDFHASVTGSKRNFGVRARHLVASRSFGTAPDNGKKRIQIPWLKPYAENDTRPAILSTFTSGGQTWTIQSYQPEKLN